jgi:LruC domain-containing protein
MKKLIFKRDIILVLFFILSTFSCKKASEVIPVGEVTNPSSMVIPANFDYATSSFVQLSISAKDIKGTGIGGIVFDVFEENPQINPNAILLTKGVTDKNGNFENVFTIAKHITQIFIRPNYIGMIDLIQANVAPKMILNFNPSQNTYSITHSSYSNSKAASSRTSAARTEVALSYLGTWNTLGVPNYLDPVSDIVDASFLADVNTALPEGSKVPIKNPEYIASSTQTDIILIDSAAVWVTFVHEGAGWRSALGFYTYDVNNPPTSQSQITNKTIIFPNVSYLNSGGGLASGMKVKIGNFSANTGIGWFIVSNAWNGSNVGAGYYEQYSNPNFNIETNSSLKAHMVMLKNDVRNRILLGFEDVNRENWPIGCDQDFNDVMFFVTANPYTAIQTTNVISLPTNQTDSDNDGVGNAFDAYPTNPDKAFDTYFPSQNQFGSLCFEDLWPAKGDYDFNDLVINYNYQQVLNAQNKVVEMVGKFYIGAIGASYRNGFGFRLPISPSKISQITGQRITNSLVSLSSNNTESGQTQATVIVYDDPEKVIHRASNMYFNTDMSLPKGTSDTLILKITFSSPISPSELGVIPFDPFIIVNQNRGIEVHLPDKSPTQKADVAVLGTKDDDSQPAAAKFYKTTTNLVFGLHVPLNFNYPVEKAPITVTHLKFAQWATSGGTQFTDWYTNKTNYRNTNNIYSK